MAVLQLAKRDTDGDVVDASGAKLARKDRASHTGTQLSSTISDLVKNVQDIVGAQFAGSHVGCTVAYNGTTGAMTITVTGGGGSLDAEAMMDFLGGVTTAGKGLIAGNLITVTYDDPNDKITLATTATANSTDAQLRARASHTGTQLANTISDFNTAVSAVANPYTDSQIAAYAASHPYAQRKYDNVTSSWDPRPAVPTGTMVLAQSRLYVLAPPPPNSQKEDIWIPHPDSSYWPA